MWLASALPVAAQSIEEYFQFRYQPVSFSQIEIEGSQVFYATILASATCTKDLPVSVSEATITSRVIAEHAQSGTRVTLNSSYTITIKPFPSKAGDITEINQVVPLKFPAQAESGDYNVIGVLSEARVKVVFAWLDVTEYLPQNHLMGTLRYTAPEPIATDTPASTTTPSPSPAPASTPEPPPPPPAPSPAAALTEYVVPWWVWLIVVIAVTTTMANIIWFLRQRPPNRPDST